MNAGEHDLILTQKPELTGLELLHLRDKIALLIYLLHGVHHDGSLGLVGLVLESGSQAGSSLDVYLMAVALQHTHLGGRGDDAVLALLDIL